MSSSPSEKVMRGTVPTTASSPGPLCKPPAFRQPAAIEFAIARDLSVLQLLGSSMEVVREQRDEAASLVARKALNLAVEILPLGLVERAPRFRQELAEPLVLPM